MKEKGKNLRIIIVSLSIALILVAILIYILAINGKFGKLSTKNQSNEGTSEQPTQTETNTIEEKKELNATLGELYRVLDEGEDSEFVIDGLILLGNRHLYYDYKADDETVVQHIVEKEDGYKSTELNSLFYLNEYIEFYISTHYAGSEDDVKIIVVPHKDVDEFKKMSFEEIKELSTQNGGFVIDYKKPDETNFKYVGEGYVNMDYPTGKYDILFTYKGKVAYVINIELVKEP